MRFTSILCATALPLCLALAGTARADSVPALSEEAAAVLQGAETRVSQAREQKALWTSTEAALHEAREAARKGDSAAVLKFAGQANDQAFLGMAQLHYPVTGH